MKKFIWSFSYFFILFVVVLFFSPGLAFAHCDTLDGPVVTAARKALEKDNVNFVLIWIKPENEDEIRKALKKARDKLKNAKTDKEKEDIEREFFETLVRVHREGEGAGYEGLKPAGSVEPEIALADKAVETKSVDEVLNKIRSPENREVVLHLFHKLQESFGYDINDLRAGREFVEDYATFIHAVEKALKGEDLHEAQIHNH